MAAKKAPAPKKQTGQPAKKEAAPALAEPGDNLPMLEDMPVMVQIELGHTQRTLEDAVHLGEQSLIELDRQVGEPVNVLINGKLFARGEVVTVQENFGVRLTEILSQV